MYIITEPLEDQSQYVDFRIIPSREGKFPCSFLICLIESLDGTGMYPEYRIVRMCMFVSVTIFDGYLRLSGVSNAKLVGYLGDGKGREVDYPTPPIPASAIRCSLLNLWLILAMISSRPTN